jgi:hypothetical protein
VLRIVRASGFSPSSPDAQATYQARATRAIENLPPDATSRGALMPDARSRTRPCPEAERKSPRCRRR